MKKKNIQNKTKESVSKVNEELPEDQLPGGQADDITIKEFIKIKKLQNQILEKMLEKMSHPDPKEKGKNL